MTTQTLMLDGVPVYVSGVAGHFVCSDRCSLRMAWRVGMLLISTVGGFRPDGPGTSFATVGSGRWSETMIFRVEDHPGEPEGRIAGPSGVTTTWVAGPSTRDAERLHLLIAIEIAAVTDEPADVLRGSEIDAAIERARTRFHMEKDR